MKSMEMKPTVHSAIKLETFGKVFLKLKVRSPTELEYG